jgi:hypothetical protein
VKARISRGRNYLKRELEEASSDNNFSMKNEEFQNGRA